MLWAQLEAGPEAEILTNYVASMEKSEDCVIPIELIK